MRGIVRLGASVVRDEVGGNALEYTLIASLIAIAAHGDLRRAPLLVSRSIIGGVAAIGSAA